MDVDNDDNLCDENHNITYSTMANVDSCAFLKLYKIFQTQRT